MSDALIRFPAMLQLEIARASSPDSGEIQTPGETVYLHEGDELSVEIRGSIMDRITVHTRQGAVIRQFTHNRLSRSKKGSRVAIGRAEDYLDGELVIVVHAYVSLRKYYTEYFRTEIEEWQQKLNSAADESSRNEALGQLRDLKADATNFHPKDYAFLPYVFHWNLVHVGQQAGMKPLPSLAEARRLREENSQLRHENEKLSQLRDKESLEKSAETLRAENEQLKKKNEALQKKHAELTALTESKETDIGKLRIMADDLLQEQESLESQARQKQGQVTAHRAKLEQLEAELQQLKESMARIDQEREAFLQQSGELTELRKQEEQLKKDEAAAKDTVTGLRNALTGLEREERELRETLKQLETLEEQKKTLADARKAFEEDRDDFVDVLLKEPTGKTGSASKIKKLQTGLRNLDNWEGVSQKSIQQKKDLYTRLDKLIHDFEDLKWSMQQESANRQ